MAQHQSIILHGAGLQFSATDHAPDPASASGSAELPAVVCLHGFPDSPATFRHQTGPLTAAGYRVIVPTLRGYEPSSVPADGDFSLMTLAEDVIGWLDDRNLAAVHLIGHDWGAAIAYTAAAAWPDRFRSLTTLAIPPLTRIPHAVRRVPRQLRLSWYMNFFQLRGVAERTLRAGDWRLMRRLWRSWSPGYTMTETHWADLRHQFGQPGVLPATLGYYRQNATPPILLGLRSTEAMALGAVPVPTLVLHGQSDGCMDRRLFNRAVQAEDFPAGVERVEVPGVGHFLHLERPDAVNTAVLRHLELAP